MPITGNAIVRIGHDDPVLMVWHGDCYKPAVTVVRSNGQDRKPIKQIGVSEMNNKKSGFTLVEIMIVVAIIGLLAAIAIPSFLKARTESQTKGCVNNLRILDAAKEQAAMELGWAQGSAVAAGSTAQTNVLQYVKNNSTPHCPANGTYTFGNIGSDPTCSLTATHHL